MQPVNATATTSPCPPAAPSQPTSRITTRLSAAQTLPTSKKFEVLPQQPNSGKAPAKRSSKALISPPVYSTLTARVKPEGCTIVSQKTLDEKWSSIQHQLRARLLPENEVLQILKSGILQTDTGKALAPLCVEAFKRSINSLNGPKPKDLKYFVDVICNLPLGKWASALGEDFNFPLDHNGEGIYGLVQKLLELSREQQEKQIADGILLDTDTLSELRDFTKQALLYFPKGDLSVIARMLDDYKDNRPLLQDAKNLVAEFKDKFENKKNTATPGAHQSWSRQFPDTVKKLYERLIKIEIKENQPQSMAGYDILFTLATAPGSEIESRQSQLLIDMQEVEKRASFYGDVVTTGPRYIGGFFGKFLYVANVLNTFGILSVEEKIKPPPKAIPEDPVVPPEAHNSASMNTQSAEPGADSIKVSLPIEPISEGGSKNVSSAESPVFPPGSTMEMTQAVVLQTIRDSLTTIDDFFRRAITFPPLAKADDDTETPLLNLQKALEDYEDLAERPVYGNTVETLPTSSERFGSSVSAFLSNIIPALTPYIYGVGSTVLQPARDYPNAAATAAFATLYAIYNEFCQQVPDQSPGEIPLPVESPALHEELVEDAVENILHTPIAKGQPPLSEAILELMYESEASNLLYDDLLIGKVAQLLEQPSPQVPGKTFAELIKQALVQTHDHDASVQAPDIQSSSSGRVKRDTEAVDAEFASFNTRDEGEPPAEAVGSETDNEARLTQYLKAMDELQRSDIDSNDDIGNGPMESPTEVSREVVRVVRKRRNVSWVDSSRAAGDRELVPFYTAALPEYVASLSTGVGVNVEVPMHSTFGRCWSNYVRAIKNPFFIEWATRAGVELSTVKVITHDGSLSAKANNIQTTFNLTDNTGWADVAKPILGAVGVIDPTLEGVPYPDGAKAPFDLVHAFHGEKKYLNNVEAQQRANELNASQKFSAIKTDDSSNPLLLKSLEQRTEAVVERQKQHLGDLYTHASLVTELTSLVKDKPDNATISLDNCSVSVDADSSFALKHPAESSTAVSAQRFINESGWITPKNAGEVRNFIAALTFAMPDSPERGNYRGALDYEIPPTAAQRKIIRDTVNGLEKSGGLLDYLLENEAVANPAQGLNLALDSYKAKTLGKTLEAKLGAEGISTAKSGADWVMAAMLLDIDASLGTPRNHVGGYNLTQEANWAAKPATVVTHLENHLVANGKVSAKTAPVASRHLLATVAPEFLVRNIPDNLVCGSHTWATLRIAAARIEQINPGAVLGMTFEQVMKYGETTPISVGQQVAVEGVSRGPLYDWAIANGVIQQDATDTYSEQQLDIARDKFKETVTELASARDYLTAAVPTRKDIALAELTRVFGKDYPFEERLLRENNRDGNAKTKLIYSLLDLYMTGDLTTRNYLSTNEETLPLNHLKSRFSELNVVSSLFKEKFTNYFNNLSTGSETIFKHLVSQLPPEDRKSLEYGETKYYSIRSATDVFLNIQTTERIAANVGHHGILIRSEHQQKVTYYEVFPAAVQIRKRTDLPRTLEVGGKIRIVHATNSPTKGEAQVATPQKIDLDAYQKGTIPRSGVKSNVIIDEIEPVEKKVVFYPPNYDYNTLPNAFSSANIKHIAAVAVSEHFIIGRDKLHSLATGVTDSENDEQTNRNVRDFFLGLIPFKDCIGDLADNKIAHGVAGCFLDAAGFIILGIGAAGKMAKVATTAGRFIPGALKMARIATGSLLSSANPLDGLGGLANFGKNVAFKTGSLAYSAGSKGIQYVKNLYCPLNAVDSIQLLKRADVTAGTINAAEAGGQATKVSALLKGGKWYAYDAARNRPYGAPLENFRPDSSIPLERTTFSDGSSALTPSRLFETESHIIRRTAGVDVVVGDKVYRFDPERPEALEDITSPTYFKAADEFEDVCSMGGRSKRSPTPTQARCFTKRVAHLRATRAIKQAQAIEHKRLFSTRADHGQIRKVVHERRLFTVADNGHSQKLLPSPLAEPLQFRSRTTGDIIDDKHFGLPNKQVDADLELNTRVIRVNGIVHGIDDQRDVRGFLVNYDHQGTGTKTYLVVESDTGLHYYCDYDATKLNNIDFTKIDMLDYGSLGSGLIKAYDGMKDKYIAAAGTIINNDLVTLPPLDSLYMDLVLHKGFTPQKINDLKAKTALLTEEKKREFVLAVWNRGNLRNVEIATQTIKIEAITKPRGFKQLSAADQNKIYSDRAKAKVDLQFEATGLKSENQVINGNPADLQRQVLTRPVVTWTYSRYGTPFFADATLKTGAGNCDQMAWAAKKIIDESGGTADIWAMPGAHAFTLVGVPRGTVAKTVDFSEPAFRDAWVVDPWAEISCPAREYITRLDLQMALWETQGKMIFTTDWQAVPPVSRWTSPTDPLWIAKLKSGEKMPS